MRISGIVVVSSIAIPETVSLSSLQFQVSHNTTSKFRSIFSDNLQPIATRGKKARGTLLVDIGCSSKRLSAQPSLLVITTGAVLNRIFI